MLTHAEESSCTTSSAISSSRPSSARTSASSRRPARARSRRSSSSPTCAATSTRTRPGRRTARRRSEEMATAAKARGYRYLAVTDHSHYLREGRMEAQDAELDALNEKLAPFRLLKGSRRTSRRTGRSTCPTTRWPTREWVIASLHTSFDKNPTERILGAMENPHVRLHRPPARSQDRQARGRRARRRAGRREGGGDGDVPRDRLAAGPPRHAGLRRAAGRRGRRSDRRDERCAPRLGARLRRARRRPGAPRVADQGAGPEHAHLGADREDPQK